MANNGSNKTSGVISELDKGELNGGDDPAELETNAPEEHILNVESKRDSVHQLSGRRVLVTIPIGESDENKYPVPIGLNGELILVPRNVKVSMPEEYFAVLQGATKKVYSSNIDNKGNSDGIDDGQDVPRFSYVYHGVDPRSAAAQAG